MGECLSKSAQLSATIESASWEMFDVISKLSDERQATAQSIRSSIVQALQSDEHVTSLGPTLVEAQSKALRLLAHVTPPTPPASSPVTGAAGESVPGVPPSLVVRPTTTKRILESESRSDLSIGELKKIVNELEQKYIDKQVIKFNASWIVEENGGNR